MLSVVVVGGLTGALLPGDLSGSRIGAGGIAVRVAGFFSSFFSQSLTGAWGSRLLLTRPIVMRSALLAAPR